MHQMSAHIEAIIQLGHLHIEPYTVFDILNDQSVQIHANRLLFAVLDGSQSLLLLRGLTY